MDAPSVKLLILKPGMFAPNHSTPLSCQPRSTPKLKDWRVKVCHLGLFPIALTHKQKGASMIYVLDLAQDKKFLSNREMAENVKSVTSSSMYVR